MHTNIITAGLTILLGLVASARHVPAQESQPKADKFAQIAAIQADYGRRDLISIAPEPWSAGCCRWTATRPQPPFSRARR